MLQPGGSCPAPRAVRASAAAALGLLLEPQTSTAAAVAVAEPTPPSRDTQNESIRSLSGQAIGSGHLKASETLWRRLAPPQHEQSYYEQEVQYKGIDDCGRMPCGLQLGCGT